MKISVLVLADDNRKVGVLVHLPHVSVEEDSISSTCYSLNCMFWQACDFMLNS